MYAPLRHYENKSEAEAMKKQLEREGHKSYYKCVWYVYVKKND